MPERFERHLSDDRDRGRVEQLGHLRPDERRSDEGVARAVDDELGVAPVAVAKQAGPGDLAEVVLEGLDVDRLIARRGFGEPDGGGLGIGEVVGRSAGITGNARRAIASIAASCTELPKTASGWRLTPAAWPWPMSPWAIRFLLTAPA